jgi:protein-disulfide isomerase
MSKAARTRSARERLAEERKRKAAKEKRLRALLVSGAALLIVALVVAGVVFFHSQGKKTNSAYSGPLAPAKVEQDGTVVMAQPNFSGGPSVEVYEDFQCPICKAYESASGDVVKRLAGQGKIKVTYHVLAFVNPEGSTRAAVAGKCAADAGRFIQFHDVAYKDQPDEREALTIDKLKQFGKKAGITSGSYDSCVSGQQFVSQVKKNTQTGLAFLRQKLGEAAGTPTMLVNGKPVDKDTLYEPSALEKMILAAGPAPSSVG